MAVSQSQDNYAALHSQFRWHVPPHFNIAQVCSQRWAQQAGANRRVAIYQHQTNGAATTYSYAQLQKAADALSHALVKLGVQRGDRVAIVLPQRFETAVAYMAVLQMGAVAMPLSQLFGPEALEYRLQDSGAVVAIGDESTLASLHSVRATCPHLRCVIGVADDVQGPSIAPAGADAAWHRLLAGASRSFDAVPTKAEEGAVLIYTSGTTGPPKGALIPHRALLGNLSGFVCSQNWFGFDPHAPGSESNAVFWSPADWAWTGGLMDALLPTLYFGRPIVAYNGRFSPELAYGLLQAHGVTHTFLFPTALKAMMKAYPQPRQQFKQLKLQAIMSAGEAVGDAVFAYCQNELGVTVNEMFGQTESNYIVGNCAMNGQAGTGVAWPAKPGSMGRPYPGHRVAVIDEDGQECPVGVAGDVALHRYDIHGDPDPIFFLGYWKNDAATLKKFTGRGGADDWGRTGDMATRDADGYLWYQGRGDDLFKAAGYRIGPSEIENCLVKHVAVMNAAVVPKPDAERGAVVKAYVVLAPDFAAQRAACISATGKLRAKDLTQFDNGLIAQLQLHVKGLLAPYEYPKEIEFIDVLPMTTTGKVQRRVLRLQEEERARLK